MEQFIDLYVNLHYYFRMKAMQGSDFAILIVITENSATNRCHSVNPFNKSYCKSCRPSRFS